MANTSALKEITEFAVSKLSSEMGVTLKPRQIPIGKSGRLKEFDGASADSSIVVQVINHGGYTSGGKLPSAKIKNTYADCYFLSMTTSKRKILAITSKEFFNIFKVKSEGYLQDIELTYIDLPQELKEKAATVLQSASEEMQNRG